METLKLWIARDKDGELCLYYGKKPEVCGDSFWYGNVAYPTLYIKLDSELFPEVTFENSPKCVILKLEENEIVDSKK